MRGHTRVIGGCRGGQEQTCPAPPPELADLQSVGTTDPRRVCLPAPRVAEAFEVSQSAGGPLAAFVDVAYRGTPQSTWRILPTHESETALHRSYLPDGLVDDPHEHACLATSHMRGCAGIIGAWGQLAGSTAAAALEPGPDTAHVLGSGLTELLAYAAR